MTEPSPMTREQMLETLRSAASRIKQVWDVRDIPDMGELYWDVQQEVNRVEKGVSYTTPAPAPVNLPFESLVGDIEGYTAEDDFTDFLIEVAEEYDVPLTNNETRWQDGRWLREQGAFIGHIKDAIHKSGIYVTRKEYEIIERIKDDAINVANAEKRKREELELELEMWQKGYRKR